MSDTELFDKSRTAPVRRLEAFTRPGPGAPTPAPQGLRSYSVYDTILAGIFRSPVPACPSTLVVVWLSALPRDMACCRSEQRGRAWLPGTRRSL
jgi:hypothetical protein